MKCCWSFGVELRGTNPQFCSECEIKLDDGKSTSSPTRTVGGTSNVNDGDAEYYAKLAM